jgi:hypothetical protein
MSDPALLGAARKQLARIMESRDAMAFLGWWEAWKAQDGVGHDDLVDLVKELRGGWPRSSAE